MKIALVTYQDQGQYHSLSANEDAVLTDFLSKKGLTIEMQIWNDKAVDWSDYDLAILKSPWDYFNLVGDFYHWLGEIKTKNVPLLNPVEIVKWNADKHYLQEIEAAGLNVTPSIFLTRGDDINLNSYFDKFETDKFIVKPCVSGGSKNTFKVASENIKEVNEQLKQLILIEDFIVQPFLKEIEEEGEWSFIFFAGQFSHALVKKAKAGDFRVQPMFGGTVYPQTPSKELIAIAQQYVMQFANGCLYARVDGTFANNGFMLMELELIEPYLFLDTNENALENYYKGLKMFL